MTCQCVPRRWWSHGWLPAAGPLSLVLGEWAPAGKQSYLPWMCEGLLHQVYSEVYCCVIWSVKLRCRSHFWFLVSKSSASQGKEVVSGAVLQQGIQSYWLGWCAALLTKGEGLRRGWRWTCTGPGSSLKAAWGFYVLFALSPRNSSPVGQMIYHPAISLGLAQLQTVPTVQMARGQKVTRWKTTG